MPPMMMVRIAAAVGVAAFAGAPAYPAEPVRIVAAENFYGDVAGQIGGSAVHQSICGEGDGVDDALGRAINARFFH
jgi:hypothetical protein